MAHWQLPVYFHKLADEGKTKYIELDGAGTIDSIRENCFPPTEVSWRAAVPWAAAFRGLLWPFWFRAARVNIGSHNVKTLLENGREVVVIDNLLDGPSPGRSREVPFYKGAISAIPADLAARYSPITGLTASCILPPVPSWLKAWIKPLDYFTTMSRNAKPACRHGSPRRWTKLSFHLPQPFTWKKRKNAHREDAPLLPANPLTAKAS